MKSTGLWVCLAAGALLTALLAGCDNGEKSKMENSVRFVDTQRVLSLSGLGEQESAHLQAVNQKLRDGMAMAQTRHAALDEVRRLQAEQSDSQLLEMQWRAEQQAAHKVVSDVMLTKIEDWRQKYNVGAILPRQHALAIAEELDITTEIAKELKNVKPIFGQLPQVSLREDASEKVEEVTPAAKK